MNISEFNRLLKHKSKELDNLIRKKMPVLAGNIAKNHIKNNFRKGGFMNNGLTKWPIAKRQLNGSSYGPLLSKRDHLMNNIRYTPRDYAVTVINDTPYAKIHNDGGTVQTTVTPKMRKYAWYKYYASGGKESASVPEEAQMWKRLALTRKEKLSIHIPQRRFMGSESKELREEIRNKLKEEIIKTTKL